MLSRISTAALIALAAVFVASFIYARDTHEQMAALRAKHLLVSFPGRTAVVVGGTSGIGEGIALRLAAANFTVTIVGRNAARGQSIVQAMSTAGGSGHSFVECDAQLIGNVRAFADKYKASHTTLDVLVLTQGIATIQGYTPTSEGIDQKMALHFYTRMAFIESLLPLLRAAPAPKVLSVLSGGVHQPYANFKEDPDMKDHYTLKNAAHAAGFYTDLAMDAYSQDPANAKVTFVHAAPGFVSTRWGTEMPWYLKPIINGLKVFARTKEDCAEAMCVPLFDEEKYKGGFHVVNANGGVARTTAAHTTDAIAFIAKHTADVIARASSAAGSVKA